MSWNMRSKQKEKVDWNPPKSIAKCCNTIIFSKYPGQFCSCKCGKAFVDQTEHYSRHSGELEEYIPTQLEMELK